ncbi:PpiC-type peptidyl-prolyl cis-trans isomerase [Gloeothece citriformis PCC 7424]|uniref:peptidylprolyl isomerase n=1 Tax=Gloeothece citriformis (strain PCC 7424) TaxID=65393 RepID=B7KGP0_GLOC7|nr:peptidylprolyl isomerase [Gloeothece citriformis]ACK71967.1 PpiC-type peptidyl-prolyl cis-trans isomerase [Gloeothece citriformis PCC 7424]
MGVVLQVGEQKITESDLYPLLGQYRLLPQLVKEIIIDQAIAEIECTPEEQQMARNLFYQQNQLTSEEKIQAWLKQQGITREQLEYLSLRELKLEKFKQVTWGNKIEPYFLKIKGKLDRVIYSLIRTKDTGIAQELYFRIQDQENTFEELAKKYSQGPEAQTGGLIGPVELNVPHPTISQMLMGSQPGQLWPPTQIGEWIIIIRLEQRISTPLDQQTQQRILNELFQGWLIAQMQQIVSFLPSTESINP